MYLSTTSMENKELQKNIALIVQNKRLSPEVAAIIKAAVRARLDVLESKRDSDSMQVSFVEQSTQTRENESAIARKTHYHLRGIESALHTLIEITKSK